MKKSPLLITAVITVLALALGGFSIVKDRQQPVSSDGTITLRMAQTSGLTIRTMENQIHIAFWKEMGADAALFPEMFSNGYHIYGRPVSDWIREARVIVSSSVISRSFISSR